jgi:hypothetical protein
MLPPVPAEVPPHEPLNHSAEAPEPAEPPVRVKVVLLPEQMVVVPEIPVGADEADKIVKLMSEVQIPTVALIVIEPAAVGVKVVPEIEPLPVPPTTA